MRACVIAAILFLAPALHAQSNCTSAKSPIQQAICTDSRLAAADRTMGNEYRNDLAQLTSASIGLLRADQVQWLAWIQQLCHADEAANPTDLATCLPPLYTARIKALRTAVVRRDGLSFLTRTQYLAFPDTEKPSTTEPHPGFGTMQASWPIADSTDGDWLAWNHAVEARTIRLAGRPEESSAQTAWQDDMAQEQDSAVHAQLRSIEHDRLTVAFATETMAHGGAHPYELFETQTYLLNEHRALRADDVFKPDSEWKAALANACWQQMSTSDKKSYIYPQIKGPDAKEIVANLLDVRNWTLEHDGLHISYPEYSVSPRYALMDDTVIPWGSVQGLLSPTFVAP